MRMPIIVPLNLGRSGVFVVPDDLYFSWRGDEYRIVGGMTTDLASVPWLFRWFIGRTGRHAIPAILHDAAYDNNTSPRLLNAKTRERVPMLRSDADALFLDAMRETDTPLHQRVLAYWAVRLFGFWAWESE